MELGAGPAGAGVGAEGGVWKLGAAGHGQGRSLVSQDRVGWRRGLASGYGARG